MKFFAFDLDGTLFDSRSAIVGCFHHAMAKHGLAPVADEAIASRIGLPLSQMLTDLVDPEAMDSCLETYSRAFPDFDRKHSVEFPGVLDVVRACRAKGGKTAITSSKSLRGIERIVRERNLGDLFDALWGGDMVENGKPHPEMLLRAMAGIGAVPEATMIVGDTTYDVEMGVSAGATSVGVSWGMHGPERLVVAGADCVVHDAAALHTALLG